NNAHVHIRQAMDTALEQIPYEVTGADFDNGSEFINHDMIEWAACRDIYFTRSRPYKKNDQATIESKNNHLVRRYAYYWRYDTQLRLSLLNGLWPLRCDRMNYLTPTRKPIEWATDAQGRRKRIYDDPATPFDQLLDSGILTAEQTDELTAHRNSLNPAHLGREIDRIQQQLTLLAKQKTLQLQATHTKPRPDTNRGVKLHDAS